jgi:chromosome segregation ATPase
MTELTTESLLQRIRKSEEDSVEKQQRIKISSQRTDALKTMLSQIDLESKKISHDMEVTKQRLQSNKTTSVCMKIHLQSLEQQEAALDSQIQEARDDHKKLTVMVSGVVDQICLDVHDFTEGFGVAASQERVTGRRAGLRNILVKELQELENCYLEVNGLEAAIVEHDTVAEELEETGKSLADKEELRDLLKSESVGLMEKIHSLNLVRSDSSNSLAAQEVRQLRVEISQLVQATSSRFLADQLEWPVVEKVYMDTVRLPGANVQEQQEDCSFDDQEQQRDCSFDEQEFSDI